MITICITIGVVALMICATVAYIIHDINVSKLDTGDISKLEDIYIIADHVITEETEAERKYKEEPAEHNFGFYFDLKLYKDAICKIYKITENYKNG